MPGIDSIPQPRVPALLGIGLAVFCCVAAALVVESEILLAGSDTVAGDFFGEQLAACGDDLVVGAARDDDAGPGSGSAYVFLRSGTSWSQVAKLVASDASAQAQFGLSVACDGSAIVIGAPFDHAPQPDSGSAYVFIRQGTAWIEQAKLTASDGAAGDTFGHSVDIDGDWAVVGTRADDDLGPESGSAYVYLRIGSTWSEQAKLTASDGSAGDQFGRSVDIDASTIAIGAPFDDDLGEDSGAVYVFVRSASTWAQQAKLTASDTVAGIRYGFHLSLDGEELLAGARSWEGSSAPEGAAYHYVRSGTAWSETFKLVASDPGAGDRFGVAVALAGNRVLIGAPFNDDFGLNSGSAYLFERSGTAWIEQLKLLASNGAAGDDYGRSVALAGDLVAIGAPFNDVLGPEAGVVHGYEVGPLPPVFYCSGKTSSLGCVPFLSTSGTPSTSGVAFWIQAHDVLPSEVGRLLYGFGKSSLGFHGGTLCVKAPLARLPGSTPSATGQPPCSGVLKRNFNQRIQSGVDPGLTAGAVVMAQWIQRDVMDPAGFGDSLSNAVRFVVCP